MVRVWFWFKVILLLFSVLIGGDVLKGKFTEIVLLDHVRYSLLVNISRKAFSPSSTIPSSFARACLLPASAPTRT